MEIVYKKKFFKDLRNLPPSVQQAVKIVLDKLKNSDSFETAKVDCVKMEGQKPGQNYYRIRVGRYRIGAEYVNQELIIIMIASRGSIYPAFPPK